MFSDRLKKLRKERGFLQADMACKIGITKSAYGYYEQGKTTPDIITAKKIANILDVSVDYLLGQEADIKTSSNNKTGFWIPVLGSVQAGIPIDAVQDIIDYEEITADMAETGEYFALQVRGSSMEPRIKDGDIVIVRQQPEVENGEIAIVLVNGNDATIKKIGKSSDGIMLVPNNPVFEPIFYNNEEIAELPVVILGKVVELRAKF